MRKHFYSIENNILIQITPNNFTKFKLEPMKTFKTILITTMLVMCYSLVVSQPMTPRCPGHSTCPIGGGGNDPIITHWPMHGNMPNVATTFKWEPVEGATEFVFNLFDSNASSVFNVTTRNLAVFLDLPNLGLTEGSEYVITLSSDNDRKSNSHRFVLRSSVDLENALLQLETDQAYRTSTGVDKHLRKSDFLFEKSWNLQAVKALNIQVSNVEDITKIANHFEALRLKLDPLP